MEHCGDCKWKCLDFTLFSLIPIQYPFTPETTGGKSLHRLGIVQLFVRIYKSEQCLDLGGWVGVQIFLVMNVQI